MIKKSKKNTIIIYMDNEVLDDPSPDVGTENDGRIILTFTENNIEVRGDFFPPLGDGTPISGEYMNELFEKSNIVYGIQHDEIFKAFEACVNHDEIVKDVLIAKGDPPVNEIPEYLQFNPFLLKNNKEKKNEDGTVDHRARSPFILVRKDQALAKLKHKVDGQDGTNIKGETIKFQVTKPTAVIGGQNTRMDGRLLLSNINGQLTITKGLVNVRNSLVIKGAVGYGTGNIIFPGDVEIEGPVSDGFKIFSGGSVTIKQTFDVTEAVTKNDLKVAGGIIGRGRATLKVGGELRTKFIENCRVACRKNVSVEAEIINSNIYTLEILEMGEKGRIVGGEIYAVKGIRAGFIGKKTGKATRIHCGIDFTAEQEREKNNAILRNLAIKATRLKELINDPATDIEKKEKMEALLSKLEEEQRKAQARVSELLGKVSNYENATVEVKGEIVPGTLIEICQTALFVTEPLKKVRIRLGRESNKLITEKL
jgi:hypothetical protein